MKLKMANLRELIQDDALFRPYILLLLLLMTVSSANVSSPPNLIRHVGVKFCVYTEAFTKVDIY